MLSCVCVFEREKGRVQRGVGGGELCARGTAHTQCAINIFLVFSGFKHISKLALIDINHKVAGY